MFSDYQSAFAISALEPTFDSSGIVAIFSSTKTNIGSHYDTSTGKFTCQYAGTYVFVLNLYKKPQAGRIWCWIMKNGSGRAIAQVPSDSGPGFHGGSGSTVDHLVPGDKVYVGNCGDDRSNIDDRTSFVGFLLYAD